MAGNWLIEQEIDLQRGIQAPQMWPNALMLCGDNNAHTWRVAVLDGGSAAQITGSVAGYFVRPDGATVSVQGSLAGNVASVTLAQECYAYEGDVKAVMRLTDSSRTITLAALILPVRNILTDSIIDPGDVIPSLSELLAQIEACEKATNAANTAASDASTYAEAARGAAENAEEKAGLAEAAREGAEAAEKNANEKAELAETAAGNANTAAGRVDDAIDAAVDATTEARGAADDAKQKAALANDAAQGADTSAAAAIEARDGAIQAKEQAEQSAFGADTSAGLADTATGRANAAAASIEGLSVEQESVPNGSALQPTVTRDENGNIHIALQSEQGPQGLPDVIKGEAFATVEALEAAITAPEVGDQYNVGAAPPYNVYRWTGKLWEPQGEIQGPAGDDGVSPTVTAEKVDGVTTVTITDIDGTRTAEITDGKDGEPGAAGYSPTVTAEKVGGVTTVTITDVEGTRTAEINDGKDGEPGAAGYSPTVTAEKVGGVTTVTITDVNGTRTATIKDGEPGKDGLTTSVNGVEQVDGNVELDAAHIAMDGEDATTVADAISEAQQSAFQTFAHSKIGNVHELTLVGGGGNIKFVATADFAEGDTFTINGAGVNAMLPDGNELPDGFFIAGAVVIGFANGDAVYFVGGESADMNTQVIITLTATDGASMAGRTVTVTNAEDGTVIEEFEYSGQPQTVLVPVGTPYKVECSAVQSYVTPVAVEFTAAANVPRSVTISYKRGTRYGFKRSKSDSDPGAVTYLFDAVGMTPGYMDFDADAFNFGDWKDFVYSVSRPLMLKTDGTVDYELDRDDQTKKADGTASDVANTAYDGNSMTEFGSAFKWVKRYEDATDEYVIFCDVQFDETYHAYAHTNESGDVQDAFYLGSNKGSYVGSRMRSLATGAVMVSQTRATEIVRAQANGEGYHIISNGMWQYVGDLLTLVAKHDHSQDRYGAGRSLSSNTAAIANGTLKNKPGFYGKTNGTTDVKVFWLEGFWGNVWESMAGMLLDGANGIKVKLTPPYNMTGADYFVTGVVPSGTSSGFINTHSVTDETGLVPKTASGSETTYLCDGLWFNNSQVNYALVGGGWNSAGRCGSRCVSLYSLASSTGAIIGSRLSYVPPTPEAS